MELEIIDNFLSQEEFDKLCEYMQISHPGQEKENHTLGNFSWRWNEYTNYLPNSPNYIESSIGQHVHVCYNHYNILTELWEYVMPVVAKIEPFALFRIKANSTSRTTSIIEGDFHTDMPFLSEEKLKQWTTSIFYVNTNNGYTKFEDGTKVESVANRLVSFPANMKHTGTSCTDEKRRIVINFNYFK